MKPRAIICDVYRTILHVLPRATDTDDAEDGWSRLCLEALGQPPAFGFVEFLGACREEIKRVHGRAHQRGITFPEVQWPRIVGQVLPSFAALAEEDQMQFQLAEQSLRRQLSLMPEAAEALKAWREQKILLGIASNAQAYTGPELGMALQPSGLALEIFAPDLTLWSWQLGLSKPDPYFFQVLLSRLAARGIDPGEAIMVGDRADNDMIPAKALGMMTWHLQEDGDGGWEALRQRIES